MVSVLYLFPGIIYSSSSSLCDGDVIFSSNRAHNHTHTHRALPPFSFSPASPSSIRVTASRTVGSNSHVVVCHATSRRANAAYHAARCRARLIRRTATINSRISAPARFHACPSCRKSSLVTTGPRAFREASLQSETRSLRPLKNSVCVYRDEGRAIISRIFTYHRPERTHVRNFKNHKKFNHQIKNIR